MSGISKKILKTIKEEGIRPWPEWRARLKNRLFWLFVAVALSLSVFSVSAVWFMAANFDWDIYRYLETSFVAYVLSYLPYFWLVLSALSLTAAYLAYRGTEYGYRWPRWVVVPPMLISVLALGLVSGSAGLGAEADGLAANMPYYKTHRIRKAEAWNHPEKGLIYGKVLMVESDGSVVMERWCLDCQGQSLWRVEKGNEANGRWENLRPEDAIKIIGQKSGDNCFVAKEIRPWNE